MTAISLAGDSLGCVGGSVPACASAVLGYFGLMDASLDLIFGSGQAIDDFNDYMAVCMNPPVGIFDQFGCSFDCELKPPLGYCYDSDSFGGPTPYFCRMTADGCVLMPDAVP